MNPMWADVDTSESSHNHIFRLLLHPADSPEQRRKTRCSIFLSVNSQQRQPPTYPPPPASSSLTTIHNSSSSSSPWDFFRLNPNLFSASSGLDNRNAGSEGGGYGYQRLQLQTFIFGGAHGGSTNSFLFSDSLRSFSDEPIDNRARISDHNRCLTLVITIPGYHHQQPHSVGGTIANSNFLFPPNVRVDFYTGQQQQFLHPSQVPPSVSQSHNLRLGSATGSASISNHSSNNHRSFSPGLGHFRRASLGTWSDRGADLRGSLGL